MNLFFLEQANSGWFCLVARCTSAMVICFFINFDDAINTEKWWKIDILLLIDLAIEFKRNCDFSCFKFAYNASDWKVGDFPYCTCKCAEQNKELYRRRRRRQNIEMQQQWNFVYLFIPLNKFIEVLKSFMHLIKNACNQKRKTTTTSLESQWTEQKKMFAKFISQSSNRKLTSKTECDLDRSRFARSFIRIT